MCVFGLRTLSGRIGYIFIYLCVSMNTIERTIYGYIYIYIYPVSQYQYVEVVFLKYSDA